jgi:catechol 2,3-dioxygenase-like lactoylglutathione lyase family enzyme
LLVNIDVDDLQQGIGFYTEALGVTVGRRFGEDGGAARSAGSELPPGEAGGTESDAFGRRAPRLCPHWTPMHLDIVVEDIAAVRRAPCSRRR